MRVVALAVSGPGMGVEIAVLKGQSFSVGRSDRAEFAIPEDTFLSGIHFKISCNSDRTVLQDLDSRNGTQVNGTRVSRTSLNDGDIVFAGATTFLIRFQEGLAVPPSLFEVLSSQQEPVYAVLDGARDRTIYPLVLSCGMPYCSLYRGEAASDLETVAPYLVRLAPSSQAMIDVVAQGWSNAWGIFLTCGQTMEEVRKQLRRSLKIPVEGSREQMYFRFYDPRVLRLFLPLAEPAQFEEFAGPITNFFMEAEEPGVMLRFHRKQSSIWAERIAIKPPEATQGTRALEERICI